MTERFRIFEEFQPHVRAEDLESIEGFLEAEGAVQEYRVDVDTKDQVRIYIMLMKFSFQAAKDVFLRLSEFMRRSCYNIYANEETSDGVRYLYLTGTSGWDGLKMEVVIEGEAEKDCQVP